MAAHRAHGAGGGVPLTVVGRLLEEHEVRASRGPLLLQQLLSTGRGPPEDQLEVPTSPSRAGPNIHSHNRASSTVLAHETVADLTERGQRLPASLHRAAARHSVTLAFHVQVHFDGLQSSEQDWTIVYLDCTT